MIVSSDSQASVQPTLGRSIIYAAKVGLEINTTKKVFSPFLTLGAQNLFTNGYRIEKAINQIPRTSFATERANEG